MRLWQAILLGLVQGIAELLPISSSGHLKIFEAMLSLPDMNSDKMLFFDVMLHFGTLIAVIAAYHREVGNLLRALLELLHLRRARTRKPKNDPDRRMILMLLIATLPLVLGIFLKNWVEALGGSLFFIGSMLLLNGLILFFSDRHTYGKKDDKNIRPADAFWIGLAQVVAVVPGISRSGMTICAGLRRGCEREFAVKFSFLLSIPAVLGATIVELIDAMKGSLVTWSEVPLCLAGMATAAIFGYAAIRLLRYITQRNSFGKFAYYCWGVGLATLIMALIYV